MCQRESVWVGQSHACHLLPPCSAPLGPVCGNTLTEEPGQQDRISFRQKCQQPVLGLLSTLESILKLFSSLLLNQEWWKATKGPLLTFCVTSWFQLSKVFVYYYVTPTPHNPSDIYPSSNPVLFYCIHFKEFPVLWPHLSNCRMINSYQLFPNNRLKGHYLLLRTHCFCRNR